LPAAGAFTRSAAVFLFTMSNSRGFVFWVYIAQNRKIVKNFLITINAEAGFGASPPLT
jgi:hypothetical protein